MDYKYDFFQWFRRAYCFFLLVNIINSHSRGYALMLRVGSIVSFYEATIASSRWCQIVVALIGASLREEKKERFSSRETAIVQFVGKLCTYGHNSYE